MGPKEKEFLYTKLNTILELVEDGESTNRYLVIDKIEDLMNYISFN
tara:strand:+ start:498 stop:635 length:138 start_codon:yes stop_codon:yes gene_type:complete